MKQYEARYTINTCIYESMTMMPYDTVHDSRLFKAKNDKEAREKAEELKQDFHARYFVSSISIDSLVEVMQERKTRKVKKQ